MERDNRRSLASLRVGQDARAPSSAVSPVAGRAGGSHRVASDAGSMHGSITESVRDAQLQQLTRDHRERSRAIAAEKQAIVNLQSDLLKGYARAGFAQPDLAHEDPQDAARRKAREELVRQLSDEQGPVEAALEALRAGRSLAEARSVGQKVYEELAELKQAKQAAEMHDPLWAKGGGAGGHSAAAAKSSRSGEATPSHQQRSTMSTPASVRSGGGHTPRSSVSATSLGARVSPGGKQGDGEGVEDLRRQVQQLATLVEQQMSRGGGGGVQGGSGSPGPAGYAPYPPPPYPPYPYAYHQPPPYPPPASYGAGAYPAQAQGSGYDQAAAVAAAAATTSFPSLLPELAADPQMQQMHVSHLREMTLLKMELEKARTAAEIEQIRSLVQQLRGDVAAAQGGGGGMESGSGGGGEASLQLPPLPGVGGGGSRTGGSQASSSRGATRDGPLGGAHRLGDTMMHELGDMLQQPNYMDDWTSSSQLDDEDYIGGDGGRDDDGGGGRGAARALPSLPLDALRAPDSLQVNVISAGPFNKRGSYRLAVVLYEGYQPVGASADVVARTSTTTRAIRNADDDGIVLRFDETLLLRGVNVHPTTMLVFELYAAKPGVAGMPTQESLIAWAFTPITTRGGAFLKGQQSVPVYRLPLMVSAPRKYAYGAAMIDFTLVQREAVPGDIQMPGEGDAAPDGARGGERSKMAKGHEDIPGVPVEAWVRVSRGIPPADPFTPGEGFVVMIDGARFLPANVTICRVVASVFSANRQQLTDQFDAVALPDSDAFNPKFGLQVIMATGNERFEDATATLLLRLFTVDRWRKEMRVVGYAAINVFVDPKEDGQPLSRHVKDYILNQGAFQVPLHISPPPSSQPFRAAAMDQVPRVPCATLLVRILTPEAAKLQRRKKPPNYGDRVYDTSRAVPTQVERKLLAKYLRRKPLLVREAARLASGRPSELPPRSVVAASSSAEALSQELASNGGPRLAQNIPQRPLPPADVELLDWMNDRLTPAAPTLPDMLLNYNLASDYYSDLGFYVAVDMGLRMPRNLPSAALVTFCPPGSFYQDNPILDDVKVTLEYDMESYLSSPRWMDGYQSFTDVLYDPGMALLVDVRLLVPSAGTSAPAGWTCLPLFEPEGAFIASGYYHLPLFQGVPSRYLMHEFVTKGDVNAAIVEQLQAGRLRPSIDYSSVVVRVLEASRAGQLLVPGWSVPLQNMKLPRYVAALGPKFVLEMRKEVRNKTYNQAKPPNVTAEQWIEQINDTLIKVAGLDVKGDLDDDDDDDDEMSSAVATTSVSGGGALPSRGSLATSGGPPPRAGATGRSAAPGTAAGGGPPPMMGRSQLPPVTAAAASRMMTAARPPPGAVMMVPQQQAAMMPPPGAVMMVPQQQAAMMPMMGPDGVQYMVPMAGQPGAQMVPAGGMMPPGAVMMAAPVSTPAQVLVVNQPPQPPMTGAAGGRMLSGAGGVPAGQPQQRAPPPATAGGGVQRQGTGAGRPPPTNAGSRS